MDSQSDGGTVEHAVDQLADHRAGCGILCDTRRPLVPTPGRLATYQVLVEHEPQHGGDGGRRDFAALAERFADLAQRRWSTLPKNPEDFQFAVGRMLAGGTSHKNSFR